MFYNPELPPVGTTWDKMGVLAVEMEVGPLQQRGIRRRQRSLYPDCLRFRGDRRGYDRRGAADLIYQHDGSCSGTCISDIRSAGQTAALYSERIRGMTMAEEILRVEDLTQNLSGRRSGQL